MTDRRFDEQELIRAFIAVFAKAGEAPKHTRIKGVPHLLLGTNGSKKLNLKDQTFYDHEADDGGGAKDLLLQAGMWRETRRPNGRANGHDRRAEFARVHDFTDVNGNLLFQECKRWPGDRDHAAWTQRKPNGRGWDYNLSGVRRVLFRLPQLIAADPNATVYIAEGPKDCDTVAALGLVATCNPGGAGKWREDYNQFLRGRDVVILPDNDAPGRSHADEVAEALKAHARSVVVIHLPGLPNKGDVSDWVAAGGTHDELLELVREARGERAGWLRLCQFSDADKPTPIPNLFNAYTGVSNNPRYSRFLTYDRMECAALIHGKALQDDHIIGVQKNLQTLGLRRMARDTVQDAIMHYARENGFHPVMEYLQDIRWDQSPRVDSWTTAYLGVESTSYSAAIGAFFLIGMCARIFTPGCQLDYMPVLEGEQGELKSSALRALGQPWFDDNLPDVTNKDASQYLRGKWLIEIKEMHAFSKADNLDIKKFIDRREERYFARYGRNESREPRQCAFAGTTNKHVYLKDETGGRRTWPLVTTTIRLDALKRDRDQLFAEAVHRFNAGEQYWPDREFEKEHIKPEQEARFELDAWSTPISEYLSTQTYVTTFKVAKEALGFETSRISKVDQMRISATIQSLGWEPKRSNSERGFTRRRRLL